MLKLTDRIFYAQTFYSSEGLQKYAIRYLGELPTDVTTLISQGSSGCAIASAMLAHTVFPLNHVQFRKRGEDSHRSDYIGDYNKSRCVCAIVDDLIETGKTVISLLNKCKEYEIPVKYVIVGHIWNDDLKQEYKDLIKEMNIQVIEIEKIKEEN